MFNFNIELDEQNIEQNKDGLDYEESCEYIKEEYSQQNHFRTQNPKLNTQVQVDRYQTLMNQEFNTKNIPKTFGNNFRKFMEDQKKENKEYFLMNPMQKELINFINKKQTSKSAQYTIQDFRDIFHCHQTNQWFQFYVENVLLLDLINSNRVEDPEQYVKFIEQYLAGARDPLNFISNRPIQDKKQNLKIKKDKEKQKEIQQIQVQNFQYVEQNVEVQNQQSDQENNQENFNEFQIMNNQAYVSDKEFNDNSD
ncbi:unnamed protein product (macronuclear) [Paramecium tetraurelia]|uniref:Uncharacterized protein n=1 Tax=Paramecium tetraurelia TaxID=5888 RepID=A0DFG0_PARTE|nr:uncharacterized protein GSPATT00016590001 [Paramecium tetraurelia]CAK81777.1 unnamed protein product [Paramecium tetraurelia]|eukprot:XP_001449174.1 hypothetical protein (macronuclear) [Paramecium tetraurelia strain d4-2]